MLIALHMNSFASYSISSAILSKYICRWLQIYVYISIIKKSNSEIILIQLFQPCWIDLVLIEFKMADLVLN